MLEDYKFWKKGFWDRPSYPNMTFLILIMMFVFPVIYKLASMWWKLIL